MNVRMLEKCWMSVGRMLDGCWKDVDEFWTNVGRMLDGRFDLSFSCIMP